jgi:hypothetical protein
MAAAASVARLHCIVSASGGRVLTEEHKQAIRRSWRLLAPLGETVSELFYRRLFELRPELRALFPADMEGQKRKLLAMLGFAVKSLDWHRTLPRRRRGPRLAGRLRRAPRPRAGPRRDPAHQGPHARAPPGRRAGVAGGAAEPAAADQPRSLGGPPGAARRRRPSGARRPPGGPLRHRERRPRRLHARPRHPRGRGASAASRESAWLARRTPRRTRSERVPEVEEDDRAGALSGVAAELPADGDGQGADGRVPAGA